MLPIQPDWDYESEARSLRKTVPHRSHAPHTLGTELRGKDGRVVALLLRDVIPRKLHRRAFHSWWHRVTHRVTDRTEVIGTSSLPKTIGKDGRPSGFKGVCKGILDETPAGNARQETLGWSARGKITPITKKYPGMLDDNRELIEVIDDLFQKHLPQFREKARAAIKQGPEGCRRWHTAFTSVYLFKGFSSRYHKDKNNLRGVLTALTPVGDFAGGELVLPRWRVRIPFVPGDVVFFNPQEVHGNLPFEGDRLSAAFYCMRHIADCSAN
jgi:hypothetical protein